MSKPSLDIDRLKKVREKKGISKNEAAKRMGLSQPTYLRYESGERTPSIQVIKVMADVFNTSVSYLTGETDSPEKDSFFVNKETNPELFTLLEACDKASPDKLKRIMEYAKKIIK